MLQDCCIWNKCYCINLFKLHSLFTWSLLHSWEWAYNIICIMYLLNRKAILYTQYTYHYLTRCFDSILLYSNRKQIQLYIYKCLTDHKYHKTKLCWQFIHIKFGFLNINGSSMIAIPTSPRCVQWRLSYTCQCGQNCSA